MSRLQLAASAALCFPVLLSCRAILEGDDLTLRDGSGGASSSTVTGESPASTSGTGGAGTGGQGATTAASSSSGGGGGATTSSSTSATTTTSSGGVCGDGTTNAGEDCDDGGTASQDGCDDQCAFEGQTCDGAIEVALDFDTTYRLTTTNVDGELSAGCDLGGPSRFVRVLPQGDGFLSAWIRREGTTFNSAIVFGGNCSSRIFCSDAVYPPNSYGAEIIAIDVTAGVPIWISVSGSSSSDVGDFDLEVTLDRGTCDDPVEIHVEPTDLGSGQAFIDLTGSGDDVTGTCGGAGADIVFRVTGVGAGACESRLAPFGGFDGVLHTRSSCNVAGSELGCEDAAGASGNEEISYELAAPVFLAVDSEAGAGNFYLTFSSQ